MRQVLTPQSRRLSCAREKLGAAIEHRFACKSFLPDAVLDKTLREILKLTLSQGSRTGFNTQPYACVLVREKRDHEKLAEAMFGSNADKVKQAPVVAVFAADCELSMDSWGDAKAELLNGDGVSATSQPTKRVPRLQQLTYDYGAPADVVSNNAARRMVASGLRAVMATTMSPPFPVPSSVSTEAWAFKQTTFAAATFLYAAQVHGLSTCPMEGFDQIRVRNVLDIPDRLLRARCDRSLWHIPTRLQSHRNLP
ncbi:hypothetical protein PsorP6_009194 [Peronosclerospora sorghi]|uniref:Uncharacterized protein n=1 Tax=Peronosclerospora sorghi TaxID=230839 RepID=A0ACC0VYG1_9STRA|nr:hypothetical protein PsorP6_009194 [Peronosclerospora sorghi]